MLRLSGTEGIKYLESLYCSLEHSQELSRAINNKDTSYCCVASCFNNLLSKHLPFAISLRLWQCLVRYTHISVSLHYKVHLKLHRPPDWKIGSVTTEPGKPGNLRKLHDLENENKTGTSKVGAISKAQKAQFSKYAQDVFMKSFENTFETPKVCLSCSI